MQEQSGEDIGQFEDPNTENEIKKIKLALEHGMDLSKSFSGPELPPEIEGEFLDYIQQWEDQFAQRKMISVYDLAGKPAFRPAGEIPDGEMEAELARVREVLQQHSIVVDTLCDVKDRELYRFITEELMKEETNDINIPGMMHCFTYEEFHPNHEYDIKNRCTELVNHITDDKDADKDESILPWGLDGSVICGGTLLTKEELQKKITNFRDSFSSFTRQEFEYTSVRLNEEQNEGYATASIHYTGAIDGSPDVIEFAGTCSFRLKCEHEWWLIEEFDMPWG